MRKVIEIEEAINISTTLREEGKRIVLVGGCFDILHIGHILFLEKAKEHGNILMVLLESDEKIRLSKGEHRPINTQNDRARVLSSLAAIDYIVLLPYLTEDHEYDSLISHLKPAIIATTTGDPYRSHKERQAEKLGIQLISVVERITSQSTTRVAALLHKEL